jgi:hypothetical protein
MSSMVRELVASGVPGEVKLPANTLIAKASNIQTAILITIPVVLLTILHK